MADELTHLRQANRNQVALGCLLTDPKPVSEWLATIAFYKALHIIEAVFDQNETGSSQHSTSHGDRNQVLRQRYGSIWYHYKPLFEASLVARYLERDSRTGPLHFSSFSSYMSDAQAIDLLDHDLVGVESEADAYLTAGHGLSRYTP